MATIVLNQALPEKIHSNWSSTTRLFYKSCRRLKGSITHRELPLLSLLNDLFWTSRNYLQAHGSLRQSWHNEVLPHYIKLLKDCLCCTSILCFLFCPTDFRGESIWMKVMDAEAASCPLWCPSRGQWAGAHLNMGCPNQAPCQTVSHRWVRLICSRLDWFSRNPSLPKRPESYAHQRCRFLFVWFVVISENLEYRNVTLSGNMTHPHRWFNSRPLSIFLSYTNETGI